MNRIALIMEYPVLQMGGTEVLVRELVRQLAATYQIVLVTPDRRDRVPKELLDIIHSHIELPLPHSWSSGDSLAEKLVSLRVDLAHFHLGGTYTWKTRNYLACPIFRVKKAGILYLLTNHGAFGFYDYCGRHRSLLFRLGTLPFYWLSRLLLVAKSEYEISVSKSDLNKLQRWFFPFRNKFQAIYHSLLTDTLPGLFTPREQRFICVGTIGSRKGQWLLTEAFASIHQQIPEWRLTLIGRFTEDSVKTRILSTLADPAVCSKVDFIEGASDSEVEQFYKTSEIFVMPSLDEGLGLTLQEALYFGCACITTRAGGTEDLVTDNENGLLVPRDDAGALASAMLRLAKDDSLRHRVAKSGPSSIQSKGMNRQSMANSYSKLYQKIFSARRSS